MQSVLLRSGPEFTEYSTGSEAAVASAMHPNHDLTPAGWPRRFEIRAVGDQLHLRDWLVPPLRVVAQAGFRGLKDRALERAYLQHGLLPAATGAVGEGVRDRPRDASDGLFWQFPCRTEGAAWDLHVELSGPLAAGPEMHMYLGLPWASWIDKDRKQAWHPDGASERERQLRFVRLRLDGWRRLLARVGCSLRLHTVCQHIDWRDLLSTWHSLGVTDLWLSHCPLHRPAGGGGPQLRPWRLFAVNVEDPARRDGLQVGVDPAVKPLLASFVGAHAPHYLSDIRLRLQSLAHEPGFVIRLTPGWHFERQVYAEQVQGVWAGPAPVADPAVRDYNRLLTDARFALCPSGAGPNTLRLWEALAAGCVPVLLGEMPVLPEGGSLAPIDWDSIVLRVRDEELASLPRRLREMPVEEVRRRAQAGMAAFAQVRAQTCF